MSEQTPPTTGRAWHLETRPTGWPTASNFAQREVRIPAPGPGQLLVANEYLSVDPYMRGRMSDKKSYIKPYEVGEPMDGAAVGLPGRARRPPASPPTSAWSTRPSDRFSPREASSGARN